MNDKEVLERFQKNIKILVAVIHTKEQSIYIIKYVYVLWVE